MSASSDAVSQAVAVLERGGLVAFPTETVYGLGADASNPAAVARIYRVKGRPSDHPVIVHLAEASLVSDWADGLSAAAQTLMDHFWPGPLTLIVSRAAGVSDALTGGQDTIGLRVPSHPLAQALLKAFGRGIAAPSANRFGRISPTSAQHVRDDLGDDVDLVLDGGECEVGIESAIVDCSGDAPALLRPGQISAEAFAAVLGRPIAPASRASPRASGMLEAHYAPAKPLRMVADAAAALARAAGRCAVMSFGAAPPNAGTPLWIQASPDPGAYAHALYANLRRLDASDCDAILVETVPHGPAWAGVRDRLARAAGPG